MFLVGFLLICLFISPVLTQLDKSERTVQFSFVFCLLSFSFAFLPFFFFFSHPVEKWREAGICHCLSFYYSPFLLFFLLLFPTHSPPSPFPLPSFPPSLFPPFFPPLSLFPPLLPPPLFPLNRRYRSSTSYSSNQSPKLDRSSSFRRGSLRRPSFSLGKLHHQVCLYIYIYRGGREGRGRGKGRKRKGEKRGKKGERVSVREKKVDRSSSFRRGSLCRPSFSLGKLHHQVCLYIYIEGEEREKEGKRKGKGGGEVWRKGGKFPSFLILFFFYFFFYFFFFIYFFFFFF